MSSLRRLERLAASAFASLVERAETVRHRARRRGCFVTPNGPGGPILVVIDRRSGFGRVLPEILRSEGLNSFAVVDGADLDGRQLDGRSVVITADVSLGAAQLGLLRGWLAAGGSVLAIRPEPRLAALAGLDDLTEVRRGGRVAVDDTSPLAAAVCARPIQFHGQADCYRSASTTAVAWLCDGDGRRLPFPAVALADIGPSGGRIAAFTYDLPRSIVLTRQGNPEWAGQNRDGDLLNRSNDLFFGAAARDPQPDWVAPDMLDVPQADEHQRLFVQLVQHLSRQPLPRFWYLPGDLDAAVVMTGDDHAYNGTRTRFDRLGELDDEGVHPWRQVRATAYVYPHTPLSDDDAAALAGRGFEISIHVTTNLREWTVGSLSRAYRRQLRDFRRRFPSVPPPVTHRLHAVVWSDWASQAEIERANGIRLDTNYYFYPPSWVAGRAGFFTGSGLPMRFATQDGAVIDCYQVPTQFTDESDQMYPDVVERALDRAVAPGGRPAVFTANMHTDHAASNGSDAIVAAARRRGVPVISARQLLMWLDAKESSSIGAVVREGDELRFALQVAPDALGLTVLVPLPRDIRVALSASRDGVAVDVSHELLGGVVHVRMPAETGDYIVRCAKAVTAVSLDGLTAVALSSASASIRWTTSSPSTGRVVVEQESKDGPPKVHDVDEATRHEVVIGALDPGTRYRIAAELPDGTRATTGLAMPLPPIVLEGRDLLLGVHEGTSFSTARGGSVILTPANNFEPTDRNGDLPAQLWDDVMAPGRVLEVEIERRTGDACYVGFVGVDSSQRAGVRLQPDGGLDLVVVGPEGPWSAPVSTRAGGPTSRLRVEWTAGLTTFVVDGAAIAAQRVRQLAPMRVVFDGSARAPHPLRWARVSPFHSTATYTSPVFDGDADVLWSRAWLTAPAQDFVAATIAVRVGQSVVPDDSWSEWIAPGPDGAPIGRRGRYAQYRLALATASPNATPEVVRVTLERHA